MRVLVCGGRNYRDADRVSEILTLFYAEYGMDVLIHGGATGADSLASRWATDMSIPVKVYPANWDEHGKAAGLIRNEQMLREGKPDVVIAFAGGRGTAHMVSIAKNAGVKVVQVK